MTKTFFIFGCIFSFLGVAFGAFGAHALKQKLSPEMLQIFEVGVRLPNVPCNGVVRGSLDAAFVKHYRRDGIRLVVYRRHRSFLGKSLSSCTQ